jgi:hypothetical protein
MYLMIVLPVSFKPCPPSEKSIGSSAVSPVCPGSSYFLSNIIDLEGSPSHVSSDSKEDINISLLECNIVLPAGFEPRPISPSEKSISSPTVWPAKSGHFSSPIYIGDDHLHAYHPQNLTKI